MSIAYLDCFSGISGDMMLGALLDLGFEESALRAGLKCLDIEGYRLQVSREKRGGIAATRIVVDVDEKSQPMRNLSCINDVLNAGSLDPRLRDRALDIFQRLARAEAHVHGVGVEEVHFHEVGGVDTIVDVVGALLGLEALGIEKCYVSALPMGEGFVQCAHGTLPVPAPATAALLKGMRVRDCPNPGELVTPTGAALASCLAGPGHAPLPPVRIRKVGYGVGSRKDGPTPNLLRIFLMEPAGEYDADQVRILECQMDDFQPELYPPLVDRLLNAGALDVFLVPVQMKKGRPGILVQVVTEPAVELALSAILFRETTTLGIRTYTSDRIKLRRRPGRVDTALGSVMVKIVDGPCFSSPQVRPEFESCRQIAERCGVPLRDVYDEVLRCAHRAEPTDLTEGVEKQES